MARKKQVEKEFVMNPKEFKKALELIVKEKNISEDYIYEAMELALTSAYKKNYSIPNARIEINRNTGEIKIFSFKTVVKDPDEYGCINYDEIEEYYTIHEDELDNEDFEDLKEIMFDERQHLTLNQAREIVPTIELGETIETEVIPHDFGRVAAATAKQVIIQKIREAERENILNEFTDKQDELVIGVVSMEDEKNYYINLGRTQGILPKTEIIPGENIVMNANIKVYVTKVENGLKGPLILLSRSHYGFVKRILELEIPEITDGTLLIHSVARDAGNRTKVAIESTNPNVDPVGACIGEKGTRIANILKELGNEKIDIIPYDKDIAKFIASALSPAKNVLVIITNPDNYEAQATVNKDNLSLAIGKKGINVRLASKLTRYKIDVTTYEESTIGGISLIEGE